MEHRMVLHDAGFDVGEHVHHINGNKADNRIENLQSMTAAEHTRFHVRERNHVVNQFGVWAIDDPESHDRRRVRMARAKVERIARGKADPSLIPHGTSGGATNWGCSCSPCRDALNAIRRSRRRSKRPVRVV